MQFRQIIAKRNAFLLDVTLMCLFWVCSCGPVEDSASGTGTLSFNIVYHDSIDGNLRSMAAEIDCVGNGIATVEAKVYGSANDYLAGGGPWNCDDGQGTISSVPAGSGRTVVILGKDVDDNVVFSGQKTDIDVIANNDTDAGIIECNDFVPNVLAPAHDSAVKQGAVVFQWEDVAGAALYHVLVSQNSDMSDPVIDSDSTTANYMPSELLTLRTTYYWQVFAVDMEENLGSVGSQTRSFIVAGGLPDTGLEQTSYTKLDSNGNDVGDDVTDWAMVRDNITGLIWEVKTDHDDIHNTSDTYTWQGAQDNFIVQLNEDNFGGYSDWRLPTIKELFTLVHKGEYHPAVNQEYFPNIQFSTTYPPPSLVYWSSTEYVRGSDRAWFLNFRDGDIFYDGRSYDFPGHKDHQNYVLAVRGGQYNSSLVDNHDGTVTDTATGLIWQQNGPTDTDGNPMSMTWDEALAYCEGLDLAGRSWRLPNINELQSIVDYRIFDPSVETSFFPDILSESYWSSTTFARDPNIAWDTHFREGDILLSGGDKSENHYVRAVSSDEQ